MTKRMVGDSKLTNMLIAVTLIAFTTARRYFKWVNWPERLRR